MNSIAASRSIASARSTTTPSNAIATVRFASDGEMPLAISRPVMLFGNSRRAPSGKVRAIIGCCSTGFRLATPNWNPDAGACLSGIKLSCGSLLRTSAGKRERGGLVAQVGANANNRPRHRDFFVTCGAHSPLSFDTHMIYMHLHEKSHRTRPCADRLDARKLRHRLLGAGARGHAC